ncbi:hypothetical protein J5N97_006932 [Dioscorea zingiberensis]|uniref:Uncharacterized protein n=1 Tax=Dioscorea zingiberensis TaxID=325984 RepID=A0A9D5HU18_9LILI|nr:hypothetical protein J5N97_006932 [Dioscorea zingiberensis]
MILSSLSSRRSRREFVAFTLAPPEANVIPIGHLVLVNTNSSRAGISASIKLGDTAHSDTSIGSRILRESTDLFEHSLGSANPLADKDFVGVLLAAPSALDPLLLGSPLPHSDGLAGDNCRNGGTEKRPPDVHHLVLSMFKNKALDDLIRGAGE